MTATRNPQVRNGATQILEVELSEPLPAVPSSAADIDAGRRMKAWMLVRAFTEPLGVVETPIPAEGLQPDDVAAAIGETLGARVADRLREPATEDDRLPVEGQPAAVVARSPYLAERRAVLEQAPTISVVVCTRDGADDLISGLACLTRCEYPAFEVVVVDNAPTTPDVRRVVESCEGPIPLRHVVEPRPGLSWARNCGLAVTEGEIVAFIDDDEVPDVHWLAEIARGFASRDGIDCVTGPILPAELETVAQHLFEAFGGHSKGRGFERAVFDRSTRHQQSPLYPLPPFGAGGNMAFRRASLRRVGGFDVALGAGTSARGGEDTEMFSRLLVRGGRIVYEPGAFVWHRHHRTKEELEAQFEGYGTGLTASVTALLLRHPALTVEMLRLLPRAARDIVAPSAAGGRAAADVVPAEFLRAKRRAMVRGPAGYLRARHRARRLSRGARAPA